MRKGLGRIGIAAMSVALLAACSDDALAPGGDELSPAEAAAISSAMSERAFDGWDFGEATGSRAPAVDGDELSMSVAGVPISIDYTVDVSAPCELGGTFSVSGSVGGTIDDQTYAGELSVQVATGMAECAFPAEGTTFTLSTNPDLTLEGSVAWDQGGLVGQSTFTYAGAIDWAAADGRSGNCAVDVLVTLSDDGSTVSSGTICDVSVSEGGSL